MAIDRWSKVEDPFDFFAFLFNHVKNNENFYVPAFVVYMMAAVMGGGVFRFAAHQTLLFPIDKRNMQVLKSNTNLTQKFEDSKAGIYKWSSRQNEIIWDIVNANESISFSFGLAVPGDGPSYIDTLDKYNACIVPDDNPKTPVLFSVQNDSAVLQANYHWTNWENAKAMRLAVAEFQKRAAVNEDMMGTYKVSRPSFDVEFIADDYSALSPDICGAGFPENAQKPVTPLQTNQPLPIN